MSERFCKPRRDPREAARSIAKRSLATRSTMLVARNLTLSLFSAAR